MVQIHKNVYLDLDAMYFGKKCQNQNLTNQPYQPSSSYRMAGKCKDRKESLTNGDLCSEADSDSTSRRLSFLKMVGKGKMKRESMQDHSSQGPEEEPVEEVPEVKPREPLSGKQSTSESEAVHLYSSS